jgi:hypothetical protein
MRTQWWDRLDLSSMESAKNVSTPPTNRAAFAVGLGGLIAGVCDLTYAITFHSAHGIKPIRIPQSIASGLLGMTSYENGWLSASFGVALHFFIAFSAAAIYYLASRKLRILLRAAPVCGMLYGAAIFLFMRWVVLPLSAAPHFKSTPLANWTDFAVHVFLIGLPIALMARRYGSQDFGPEVESGRD